MRSLWTRHRLVAPIVPDVARWRDMWRQFHRLDLSRFEAADFETTFSPV